MIHLEAFKTNVAAMYLDHGNALTTFATIAAFEKGEEWLDGMLAHSKDTAADFEFAEQRISVKSLPTGKALPSGLIFSELGFFKKI
ncbi:hypothetical protein O9992_22745 [Vibrio lentus]|nr:hypothetical protein [Vibrio lentus]